MTHFQQPPHFFYNWGGEGNKSSMICYTTPFSSDLNRSDIRFNLSNIWSNLSNIRFNRSKILFYPSNIRFNPIKIHLIWVKFELNTVKVRFIWVTFILISVKFILKQDKVISKTSQNSYKQQKYSSVCDIFDSHHVFKNFIFSNFIKIKNFTIFWINEMVMNKFMGHNLHTCLQSTNRRCFFFGTCHSYEYRIYGEKGVW